MRPTRYTVLNASDGLQRRLLPSDRATRFEEHRRRRRHLPDHANPKLEAQTLTGTSSFSANTSKPFWFGSYKTMAFENTRGIYVAVRKARSEQYEYGKTQAPAAVQRKESATLF